MRFNFLNKFELSQDEILDNHLQTVRLLLNQNPVESIAYGGSDAFRKVAELVQKDLHKDFNNSLVYFCFPLGARRCLDGCNFFTKAGQEEASSMMNQKAKLFGKAQYHGAQEDWENVAQLMRKLAILESELPSTI